MGSTTPTRSARDPDRPVRILFVDADERSADAAKAVFENEFGLDVTVAAEGTDVLGALESVDCVVNAVRPTGDFALLRTVRRSYPDLPYVLFSEARIVAAVGEALAAGATDFLRTERTDTGHRSLAAGVSSAVAQQRGDAGRLTRPPAGLADGSCLLDGRLRFVAATASYAAVHGYTSEELIGEPWSVVLPDDETRWLLRLARHLGVRQEAVEESTARERDGRTVPALYSLSRTADDRYVCTVFTLAGRLDAAATDRTARTIERGARTFESVLGRLAGADAPARGELCDAIVSLGDGRGSLSLAIYLYEEAADELRLRAAAPTLEGLPDVVPFEEASTPAWRAVIDHEPTLVADPLAHPLTAVEAPDAAHGILVPLDTHGVLLAGTTEGDRLSALELASARLVGVTVRTLLDRLDDRRRLETLERRLDSAEAGAERLADGNDLLRDVGRVIATAWSREELETRVCERIAASERYTFARIADRTDVGTAVRERAWAGAEKRYLESLEADAETLADEREPLIRAIETFEPLAHRHLLAEPGEEQWRRDAVARGYRSVVAVPLVFRERAYGGLAVYSERPDAFDEHERELFAELGAWIGRAIHALETKASLIDRGGVELEFRVLDPDIHFLEWARETGGAFELETVLSHPDGSIRGFFTVEDAPVETILDLARRSPAVTDTRLVTERDDKRLFECTLTEDSVVAQLLEYGAVPKTISATEAAGRLVVSLPEYASVREFVEVFGRLYPDSTLVRRQAHDHVARTEYGFLREFEGLLTDKQLAALETAFVDGYFEIPRRVTGEEVAAELGITQPTFNHHLRVAQRKLLSMLFTDDAVRDE